MADTLRASEYGLTLVDRARKERGWKRQDAQWFAGEPENKSKIKRFWSRTPISKDSFIYFCSRVGLDYREIIAGGPEARCCNIPYERNDIFTGREQLLYQVWQALTQNRKTALNSKQAVSGLGGIGKTQIAIEYAYRRFYGEDYRYVFWVNADTDQSLKDSYREIAECLELAVRNAEEDEDVIREVRGWLATSSGWLLIYDNADHPAQIKRFQPLRGNGHILLTSRAQVFDMLGIYAAIEVSGLQPEKACEFLCKRAGIFGNRILSSEEAEAIQELAKELEYFPLALEQAGAYIHAKQARFQDYLVQYRNEWRKLAETENVGLELLENSDTRPTDINRTHGGYPKSVLITWKINFKDIEIISTTASEILRYSAFFSPDKIPFLVWEKPSWKSKNKFQRELSLTKENPLYINDLLEPLTRYSLINIIKGERAYSIHRLVQAVSRYELVGKAYKYCKGAGEILMASCPGLSFETWKERKDLIPHWRQNLSYSKEYEVRSNRLTHFKLVTAEALMRAGDPANAEIYCRDALNDTSSDNESDFDVTYRSTCLLQLSKIYGTTGRYKESKQASIEAMNVEKNGKKVIDPKREIGIILNVAESKMYGSENISAIEDINLALELSIKHCGENSIDYAKCLDLASLSLYGQSKFNDAFSICKKSLNIKKSLPEVNEEIIYKTNRNLANIYVGLGDFVKAEELFIEMIKYITQIFGERYIELAEILSDIGGLYIKKGLFDESESVLRKACEIFEENFGISHPRILISKNNLALLLSEKSDYMKSEALFLEIISRIKSVDDENNSFLPKVRANLGDLYRKQNRHAEAAAVLEQALEGAERYYPYDHYEKAVVLNNLGLSYYDYKNPEKALHYLNLSLDMMRKILGDDHVDLLPLSINIANCCRDSGAFEEADLLYKMAIRDSIEKLSINHPTCLLASNSYALSLMMQKNYQLSEDLLLDAFGRAYQNLGENHHLTLMIYENYLHCIYEAIQDGQENELSDTQSTQELICDIKNDLKMGGPA